MIRSMTSYASAEGDNSGWSLRWELRSVNHRFVDVAIKLPETLRHIEIEARNRIGGRLRRGRIECNLTWKQTASACQGMRLNEPLLRSVLQAAADVQALANQPTAPVSPLDVLRWPGIVDELTVDRETIGNFAIELLESALDRAVTVREAEGASLEKLIAERLALVTHYVGIVQAQAPAIRAAQRQKLTAKLAEIGANPNPERLEQELVYWAQRLDVTEELERLQIHVREFQKALVSTEATGRRLDFLLQEMNREANTLASKSSDAESTAAAVEIKILIEQIREQVQNVE